MIRKMVLEDYEQVKPLVYQVHTIHNTCRPDIYTNGNPLPYEFFTKTLEDSTSINYVYEIDDKILGILMAQRKDSKSLPIFNPRSTYFIEDIVVDKKHRKNGIGKLLFEQLSNDAISNHIDSIELNVWNFNENAIRFYESLGMSAKLTRFEKILDNTKETITNETKITATIAVK